MTKRSNPFVEDFIPQSKTHVGPKQFNNNEDRMQKVYEKTLLLLFEGAKKSSEEINKITETAPLSRKDCMKQLLINKDGTLGTRKIIDLVPHCSVQGCGCGTALVETQCWYCEASLCTVCNRLCVRCRLPFCFNCSLLGSEGTAICVSCYG